MKNFFESGNTITFTADRDYKSGEAVVLENLLAIVHDDTPKDGKAVGYCTGVYFIPKKEDTQFKIGQPVSVKDGFVITLEKGKERNGIVWIDATESKNIVAVKINA